MRQLLHIMLLLAVGFSASACGNRGKLKTPAQVQAQEAKKAAREAKKRDGVAPEPEEVRPMVDEQQTLGTKVYPVTPSNEVAQ